MNAWYPHIRGDGTVCSGNSGIWTKPLNGPAVQVSPVGIGAFWAAHTLAFNRNDGTTQVGGLAPGDPPAFKNPVPAAYNDYFGTDYGDWAGFAAPSHIDRYRLATRVGAPIVGYRPRFYGSSFGWLVDAPDGNLTIVIDSVPVAGTTKKIINWATNRDGNGYTYTVSHNGKQIFDHKGNDITIRPQRDEESLVLFTGPDDYPWMLSGTINGGTFVRMIYAAFGYVIPGDLYYPDARIIGDRLYVVGSTASGALVEHWIDFSAPKVDLRKVA